MRITGIFLGIIFSTSVASQQVQIIDSDGVSHNIKTCTGCTGGGGGGSTPKPTRLSLNSSAVMVGDVTSSTLYEVGLDGAPVSQMTLVGMNGLYDIYSDGTALCAQPWINGIHPSQTCVGEFSGVVNPVSGVAKCLQLRGEFRRCDVWNAKNQKPLVMEVGSSVDVPVPPCCNVNGWYQVPADRVYRYYWQTQGYQAKVLIGRQGERPAVDVFVTSSLYIGEQFSPGAGLLSHQVGVAIDVMPTTYSGQCGQVANHSAHTNSAAVPKETVSDDQSAYAHCNMPSFEGTKNVWPAEFAADAPAMVLSSGARWSFGMTVRHNY